MDIEAFLHHWLDQGIVGKEFKFLCRPEVPGVASLNATSICFRSYTLSSSFAFIQKCRSLQMLAKITLASDVTHLISERIASLTPGGGIAVRLNVTRVRGVQEYRGVVSNDLVTQIDEIENCTSCRKGS